MRSFWVCVDANVVYRLVADPADTPVRQLWERWRDEHRPVAAPPLLYYEVTNALYRAQRAGLLSGPAMREALQAALDLPLRLHGDPALHASAATMAEHFGLPAAYDAHYLALAEHLRAEFWTADGRLANAVRPTLSWVRLVGE